MSNRSQPPKLRDHLNGPHDLLSLPSWNVYPRPPQNIPLAEVAFRWYLTGVVFAVDVGAVSNSLACCSFPFFGLLCLAGFRGASLLSFSLFCCRQTTFQGDRRKSCQNPMLGTMNKAQRKLDMGESHVLCASAFGPRKETRQRQEKKRQRKEGPYES